MPTPELIPDSINVRMYDSLLNKFHYIKLGLYDKDNNPNYIKFYDNKERDSSSILDVVAIPVDSLIFKYYPVVLNQKYLNSKLMLYPSCELFVVGFPYDWGKNSVYPIWKRGTIASEPNFISIGQSQFLIDATTRNGMSGSPVFFRGSQYLEMPKINVSGGLMTFLVGIYSAHDPKSEIGVVTRLEKIFQYLSSLTN